MPPHPCPIISKAESPGVRKRLEKPSPVIGVEQHRHYFSSRETRAAPVSWHGAWAQPICQLPPPEMPQVLPHPHSHSSTGNFPLALLPCISGTALGGEGAAGMFEGANGSLTAHLALLTHCTQPPCLFPGSCRREVMGEHARGEDSRPLLPQGTIRTGSTLAQTSGRKEGDGTRGGQRGARGPLGKGTGKRMMWKSWLQYAGLLARPPWNPHP